MRGVLASVVAPARTARRVGVRADVGKKPPTARVTSPGIMGGRGGGDLEVGACGRSLVSVQVIHEIVEGQRKYSYMTVSRRHILVSMFRCVSHSLRSDTFYGPFDGRTVEAPVGLVVMGHAAEADVLVLSLQYLVVGEVTGGVHVHREPHVALTTAVTRGGGDEEEGESV